MSLDRDTPKFEVKDTDVSRCLCCGSNGKLKAVRIGSKSTAVVVDMCKICRNNLVRVLLGVKPK